MRTPKTARAVFVLLTCFGVCFLALPPAYSQSQNQMNQAAERNADKANAAMNTAYKKLMTLLDPAQKLQLKKAQRAWLVYRDADADLLSSEWTGGSEHPMIYEIAVRQITEARTKELKAFTEEARQESVGR